MTTIKIIPLPRCVDCPRWNPCAADSYFSDILGLRPWEVRIPQRGKSPLQQAIYVGMVN